MSTLVKARYWRRRFKLAAISMLVLAGIVALAGCSKAELELPDLSISVYQGADAFGGTEVTLSEVLDQGKPVVLNFWAALCAPCKAEMPDIQKVYEGRGGEVSILGVDIGPQQFLGTREEGRMLLEELGVRYPVGTTFDGQVVRDFEIVGMPTTFFINADGSLLRSWIGLLDEAKINELIDDMLGG